MTSTYLHALDGRIRVKVSGIKGLPEKATLLEKMLRGVSGVDAVKANPITGNVLILYDPGRVTQAMLMDDLRPFAVTDSESGGRATARSTHDGPTAAQRLVETMMSTVLETAMRQLVTALI